MDSFQSVFTSPKISSQKNLTGNPRIVKDLAASVHADIQQWNTIYLHGLTVLKSIIAMKIDESYPKGLQELCDDLESDVDKLDQVVNSLNIAVQQMKAIALLQNEGEKLFITWPTEKFVRIIKEIYDAYKNEAESKRLILENVAHNHTDESQRYYLSTWIQQPKVSESLSINLEAFLIETGHR